MGIYIESSADISECGKYRYRLTRKWDFLGGPSLNFIMLNPSTADGSVDDPTITRCVIRAKSMGYSSLIVTNLFAWRATNPKEILKAHDPIGPYNDDILKTQAKNSDVTIIAWGNHGIINHRDINVLNILRSSDIKLYHLGLTKQGQPRHPLYVSFEKTPVYLNEGQKT